MSLLVVHTNKFLSLLPPFLQQALFQISPQPHAEQMWANAFWPPDKGLVLDPFSPTRQPQGHARQVTGLHGASEQTEVHTSPPVQASTYGFNHHYILTAQQKQNWRMETCTACPRAAGLTGWAEAATQDGLGSGLSALAWAGWSGRRMCALPKQKAASSTHRDQTATAWVPPLSTEDSFDFNRDLYNTLTNSALLWKQSWVGANTWFRRQLR